MNEPENITDTELITSVLEGNNNAFSEIIRRYEGVVAATVINMVGHEDADEVGQETMIKLYRSLDKFKGESTLKTYVTRIAMNASLDALRKKKRFFARFISSANDDVIENIPDNLNQAQSFETKQRVQFALKQLKPEYRSVAVLRLVHGYSTDEVASIIDIAPGTVLSRLSRAKRKLAEILNQDENNG